MRIPLIGGAYATRSIIASAQKCINLYPELNRKDSLIPQTLYQRPGLRRLSDPLSPGPGRGLWESTDGNSAFAVIGSNVYSIAQNTYALTQIGTISLNRSNPVSMVDNGVTVVLVDGTVNGWIIDLGTNAFSQISDSTGTFQGGVKADVIDTFVVIGPSPPGLNNSFVSTTSNQIQFNGLFVGGKTDYPDPLQTLIVNRHEIILVGLKKSEFWYDAGNPQLPFAELPGAYIEHGTIAPYSVASSDISTFMLGRDLQGGQDVVFRIRGYQTTVISNPALSFAIRQMKKNGANLADAVSYTYEQDGHYFYVLNFESGDQTWVFDDSISEPYEAWTQRGWTDQNGVLHRDRVRCFASIFGKNVGLDWQYGTLYELDPTYYLDDVGGQPYNIQYTRTFQHLGKGIDEQGQLVDANGRQMQFRSFIADIESGNIDMGVAAASMTLRYSDNRGKTFNTGVLQTMGELGDYNQWPIWRALGLSRDRVFELSWSGNGESALNGCWIDAHVLHN